jgi:hypothetical protein
MFFYTKKGKNSACIYQQNPLLVRFLANKHKILQYENHIPFSARLRSNVCRDLYPYHYSYR